MPLPSHVVSVALGSFGDVHPFLGVCRELARRGHSVDFLSNPLYEEAVRAAGLPFTPIGSRELFERAIDDRRMWTLRHGAKSLAEVVILPYMRPVYEWIERRRRPETVVISSVTAFGARLAREKLGVRLATLLLQPALVRSRESLPGLPIIPANPSLRFLARPMRSVVMWGVDALLFDPALESGVNAYRRELGLSPRRRFFHNWVHSPELSIGLFPDWYGQPQPDWPAQVHCTGFPLYDGGNGQPLAPDLQRFLDAGEPPVVLTPGTAMKHGRRFFEVGLEACQRINRRALLLSHFPEQAPSPLPSTAAHFDYAPFSQVLPRSAAIVYHGGVGTAAQALRAGIPHVITPFSYDQPDNAARLERLGVAKAVYPMLFSPGRVARALDELLTSRSVRDACAKGAERIRRSSSLDETCRLIEDLAGRPTPQSLMTDRSTVAP